VQIYLFSIYIIQHKLNIKDYARI